ncbi:MAG TPA: hypothetical protein PK530_17450, partial [Anaerolineales bacterium]|nr:hypothetical protein [Anaerolineales bacterium]
ATNRLSDLSNKSNGLNITFDFAVCWIQRVKVGHFRHDKRPVLHNLWVSSLSRRANPQTFYSEIETDISYAGKGYGLCILSQFQRFCLI